jgi:hypothetical protein
MEMFGCGFYEFSHDLSSAWLGLEWASSGRTCARGGVAAAELRGAPHRGRPPRRSKQTIQDLIDEINVPDPALVADQLVMPRDGAMISGYLRALPRIL